MKPFFLFTCVTGLWVLSAVLPLQKVLSRPLPEINPVSEAGSYNCYVVTNENRAFDLASLCGGNASKTQEILRAKQVLSSNGRATPSNKQIQISNSVSRVVSSNKYTQQPFQRPSKWNWLPESISSAVTQPGVSGGSNGSNSSGNTGTSGNCNSPNDRAANGSRCGGRSSESRPGGR